MRQPRSISLGQCEEGLMPYFGSSSQSRAGEAGPGRLCHSHAAVSAVFALLRPLLPEPIFPPPLLPSVISSAPRP